ncbi:MAG TPA: pirin family protein [Gammaproteobacteria bacterium]|nr:pirin family protein [Gammaproteobacteria bacterium]
MSYFECASPACSATAGPIELIVRPARRDLGEFSVARALPAPERTMVGPFIFFDHMGPADFAPGQGIQVRPHPHIGIATITYLFEGLVMHRDSLGFIQPIEAGAVNLMVAGRGIVHSERAGDDLNEQSRLHGIQSWMALPDAELEHDPEFIHYPAAEIPAFEAGDARVRLIIGKAFGRESPVKSFVDTLYLEAHVPAGGRLSLGATVPELAVYVAGGEADCDGHRLPTGVMAIARPGASIDLAARGDCRLMILGGAPVGHREIWWNFVAPTAGRIEKAKADWRAGRFPLIDGDDEFIPLPD